MTLDLKVGFWDDPLFDVFSGAFFCMYNCMHVCIYIYACVFVSLCLYSRSIESAMSVSVCVSVCISVNVWSYVCIHAPNLFLHVHCSAPKCVAAGFYNSSVVVCFRCVCVCVVCAYCMCLYMYIGVCLSQLSVDMAEMICSTLYANFCFWACSSCSSASMI